MPHEALSQHLQRIREAKQRADQTLEILNPGHAAAQATLATLWELLFDYLCTSAQPDLDDLNTLSAILHKLMGSHTQLRTLELRFEEHARKSQKAPPPQALSPEDFEHFEKTGRLLD